MAALSIVEYLDVVEQIGTQLLCQNFHPKFIAAKIT